MIDSQVEVCACGYGSCEGNCATYDLGTYSCQKAINLCDGLEVARVRIHDWNDGRYGIQVYDLSDYSCMKNTIKEFVATCDVCDYSLNAKIRCKESDGSDGDNIVVSKNHEFMPAILYIVVTAVITFMITIIVTKNDSLTLDVRGKLLGMND